MSKSAVRPAIRYCRNSEGHRIAYATVGSGPPIVRTATWLTNLDSDLDSPIWAGLLHYLSQHRMLVLYDERGTGLSERNVPRIGFDDMVDDLASVVDALKLDQFALLGQSQGGPVAMAFAVREPQRVSHLVLYGTYARGRLHRDDAEQARRLFDAARVLIRDGWGSENPTFRQFFSSQYVPDGTAEQLRWFTEMEHASATPKMAEAIFVTTSEINATELAPRVNVPTLVLHRRNDRIVPIQYGQEVASLIRGARFVPMDGTNHIILSDEPALLYMMREIAHFLGDPPPVEPATETQAPRKLEKAVRQVEENPFYKVFGMLAAAASVASILIWWLTR
jgi:pimeloyl-ACP methyl ester carboxylesterase